MAEAAKIKELFDRVPLGVAYMDAPSERIGEASDGTPL